MLSERRFGGFNSHPKLEGSHAVLSASNYHWLNDSEEKLLARLRNAQAAAMGTRLHAWAAETISLGRMQPEDGDILSVYVNDAITFGLLPEQLLFYSMHAYGTADAIGFEEYFGHEQYAGFLRINDYKSGVSKTSVLQLYIYAGFFCLEYGFRPFEIDGELRIYQGDEVRIYELDHDRLARTYDKIRSSNITVERERAGY